MNAAVIHQYGDPGVLKYEEFPDPVAKFGEVIVRVAAASVNPVDLMERSGATTEYKPIPFPGVLGWDVSGTVEAVGPGVKSLVVGDKVLAWAAHTYAELCSISENLLTRVPDGVDLVEAAAIPLVATTGAQLITVGAAVTPGQTVMISGALGGVGRSAVYMAKKQGAMVFAGVMARQLGDASSLGADRVVALDDHSAMNALPLFDVVANTVRGKTAEQLLAKVKDGGVFASATGAPANAGSYPSVRVVAFVSKQDPVLVREMAEAVRDRRLKISLGNKLPLKDAAAAHTAVSLGSSGKILLIP